MDSPAELVSFVTRAENRLELLLALATGRQSRRDLQEATGIPRATVSRILADFRDRDLASRDRRLYATTPLGNLLADELRSMFESVESMRALQTVAAWLPLDELGLDLGALTAVEVTLPTPVDPMKPVKRAASVIDDVEHVRGFCYSVLHLPILAECRNVLERGHRFEGVIAAGVLEVLSADPELADRMEALLSEGRAEVYVHDGAIEPQLIIADRTTMFLVADDEGAIQGLVEIGDESVFPWAVRTFESLKVDARPLTPEVAGELLTS